MSVSGQSMPQHWVGSNSSHSFSDVSSKSVDACLSRQAGLAFSEDGYVVNLFIDTKQIIDETS